MTSTTARRMLCAAALGILLAGSPGIYASAQMGGPSGGSASPTKGGCGGMMGSGMMGGGQAGNGMIGSGMIGSGMMGDGMMGGGQAGNGMMGKGMMGKGMMDGGMMGGGDRPNRQWRR